MAIRNIVLEGDHILEKKCRKVDKFDCRLFTLIDDMKETLISASGVGLAAPQVGILKRIAIIKIDDRDAIELINPVIIEKKGKQYENEGCLSCPNKYGVTVRPMWVKVKAQDRKGNDFFCDGEGLNARAFCHEIDHLNGILFTAHLISTDTNQNIK